MKPTTTFNCGLSPFARLGPMSPMATVRSAGASDPSLRKEDFFVKNERLGRPLSPHLTIYRPQLTSMLSITHRGTGCFQSALLSGFALGGQ